MKLVYCGNNERGYICLEALLKVGREVSLVVAHPDPKSPPWYRSVKALAQSAGIDVIQPEKVNSPNALESIRRCEPDVIVLAGYSQIVRREFLALPRLLCLNLHGGMLPGYRGSSPINWMILNGETQGAACIIEVDEGIDTGPILAQRFYDIALEDTAWDVQQRSMRVFPPMLLDVLDELEQGRLHKVPQNPAQGAYYPLRRPEDGLIVWEDMTAKQVHDLVRAVAPPYPGAFSTYAGKRLFIAKTTLPDDTVRGIPGRIYFRREDGVLVMCRDRCLLVREVAEQPGSPLSAGRYPFDLREPFLTMRSFLLNGVVPG